MNRRDSIKTITFASIGAGLLLEGCYGISSEKIKRSLTRYEYGRTPDEIAYDDKLFAQKFFTNKELSDLDKICNIILPPNEFGSIRDAEVVQLIEFMAKDIPSYQDPLRKGLDWINEKSNSKFSKSFIELVQIKQSNDPSDYLYNYHAEVQHIPTIFEICLFSDVKAHYDNFDEGFNTKQYANDVQNEVNGLILILVGEHWCL